MTRARETPGTRAATAAARLTTEPPLPSLRSGPMPARIGNVRIGTASWTEKTLLESGAFYPPTVKSPADRLRYYARHFPVVEVDATFYALPAERMAANWVERAPADFVFGVKAFAALTQHPFVPARLPPDLRADLGALGRQPRLYPRDLPEAITTEIWRRFASAIAPLHAAGMLGYVLLQFPKWFPRSRTSLAYLDACLERLPSYPLAVEFRDPSWLAGERAGRTFDFLRARKLAYVSVDEPQGTPASVPPVAEATTEDLAVVRFHGRNAPVWNQPGVTTVEKFGYLYSPDELREWQPRIEHLARQTRAVHVLMNNCRSHYAVQNAKDLARLLVGAS